MHLTTQRRSDSTEAATPRTATLGRSTRSLIAAAVVLTGAALTACAPTPPSTQPASNPATTTASADPVPSSGDGYELTGWAPPTAFVLRIHPSAAAFSSDVAAAAAEVTRLSGITITMGAFASSPQPDLSGTAAEIVVTTGTYCGLGTIGCTEVWGQSTTTAGSAPIIRDARVSIAPELIADAGLRRATLLHELGHAVGLGHHADRFLGREQIMNPFLDDSMDAYRDGDINGLVAAGRLARAPQSASLHAAASVSAAAASDSRSRTQSTPPPALVIG
jgi:hypothetical protein